MTDNASSPAIEPEVVGETAIYSLHELCISCSVNPDWVVGLVEHGAVEAIGPTRQDWRFTAVSLLRVAKARRLERDLGLNLPGLALALDLLDQLDAMRARLKALEERAPSL
jgi:chaperone modulatory protein CbpM